MTANPTPTPAIVDVNGDDFELNIQQNFQSLAPFLSGGDGNGALRVARVTFDTAANDSAGAANTAIGAHPLNVSLPANAVIVGGFFDVNTAFTSANSNNGTVALSVEAANDIQTAAAVSGAPYSTIGKKAIVPKANTPESTGVKTTVAREITATVAVSVLTAGKLTLFLYYVEDVVSA